ncbi:hypothetical protein GGU10DRAFT_307752 [Lentinula aff. detonsa]|uniref:HMG box domain-containing protein n=1 Tax=Lentinula aff. detonsa TaxID=2804958 RepID=A0AA38NNC2_9AGAR|nr:hypothetical protein GGU10DRAFT_307752 [Lentinula aff. detonsa]
MPLQLFGWTPSTESAAARDDFNLHRRSNTHPEPWASSPLSSSSYEEEDPDDDRPRKGDPNWIARPRNAFIIFRCDYSKRNARSPGAIGGKRGLPAVDKTMSKRAGDAWKLLSKAQRNHYKQLADQEKKEHALAHPGYRYRPKKRTTSSQRRNHQGGNTKTVPRSSKSADSRLESLYALSDEDGHAQAPPAAQVSQPVVEPTPNFLKRRSISVPLLPPLLLTPQERLGMRRSKSGVLTLPSSPISSPGSSLSEFELLYPEPPVHDSALGFGSPTTPTSAPPTSAQPKFSVPSYPVPPLAAVSSSLANWNGASATQSMDQIASTSSESSPAWVVTPPLEVNYGMYNLEGYASTMTQASFWSPVTGADSAALHSYNVGLMEQSNPEDYLLFDTPAVDEQQIFEGFCHF